MSPIDRKHEQAAEAWIKRYNVVAAQEGWCLSDCANSRFGRWQVQRLDERQHGAPPLAGDEVAWNLVLTGSGQHHEALIGLILEINPPEFDYWCRGARDIGLDLSKVPDHRKPLVVAALLTE